MHMFMHLFECAIGKGKWIQQSKTSIIKKQKFFPKSIGYKYNYFVRMLQALYTQHNNINCISKDFMHIGLAIVTGSIFYLNALEQWYAYKHALMVKS